MTLKVAIVGCGKIADGHIEEIGKMPGVARVVAVADRELLMAEQIAARYGVPAHYDDVTALLARERPDVVHVTTPPASHLSLAVQAIDAGAHVLVEKPLAPTSADAAALIAHAERAKRLLTIGYTYLFDPPALSARELVRRGVLGDPVHVESHYGYDLGDPFGSAVMTDSDHWVHRLPGKLAHNNLDHLLNKLVEWLPDECPEIVARGWVRRAARFGDARDRLIDELRITVLAGGVSAHAVFSSHAKPTAHLLRVHGTKNTMHVDFTMRTVTLDAQSRLPSALGRVLPAFDQGLRYLREGGKNLIRFAKSDFHYFSGLNRLFASFYQAVLEGGPPPIPYRDMLRVSEMIDEVNRQVPQGEPA